MNNIKEIRLANSMKQSELAKALNVTQAAVSAWELGRREPDFDALRRMSEIFNCSIDDLLGNEKAPTVENDGERSVLDVSALSPENRTKLEDYLRLLLMSQGS